ncbi:unnamed protein product [Cuscuta epithymum]|uniref:Uncharacterized protein n=1 Tax=Cuscuta epithymum TaxID=186058 RepID=A0AAV0G5Y3_9ASTE|nr:unnamed protein product [Cuscuta epithymum]
MEVAPIVFDPGGDQRAMERWLMWRRVVQIQRLENEDEVLMARPPLEPPPWRSHAIRVWENVLFVVSVYFQSNLFYFFNFIDFRIKNKGVGYCLFQWLVF